MTSVNPTLSSKVTVCSCVCTSLCPYVCTCVRLCMYLCLYLCVYLCVCPCLYPCVCVTGFIVICYLCCIFIEYNYTIIYVLTCLSIVILHCLLYRYS